MVRGRKIISFESLKQSTFMALLLTESRLDDYPAFNHLEAKNARRWGKKCTKNNLQNNLAFPKIF